MTRGSPPDKRNGAGHSCQTAPAPSSPTATWPPGGGTGERHPHFTAQPADDAAGCLNADDACVQEALARVSATMMRALLRIQANEARGAAGTQHPSGPGTHTPSS
jgi:hypothetical protein